ncbi:MAG TPA: deaminase [Candidatus Nanoarchaeia archaeon]|nr:deaminase [Candidatus Nanoarchaeia archaeon]
MKTNIITDLSYLILAIDEGIAGLQQNPLNYGGQVGCLLVGPDGNIVSRAHNSYKGGIRTHAEESVLHHAKKADLPDSTLYVTMEPCNGNPYHSRRHCCEQIVDAGIGRVVIGGTKWKFEGGLDYMGKNGVRVDLIENDRLESLCQILIGCSIKGSTLRDRTIEKIKYMRAGLRIY